MSWLKRKLAPTAGMRLYGAIEEATDLTDYMKQWGWSCDRAENKRNRERQEKLTEIITRLTVEVGIDRAMAKFDECWMDAKKAYRSDLRWIENAIQAAAPEDGS